MCGSNVCWLKPKASFSSVLIDQVAHQRRDPGSVVDRQTRHALRGTDHRERQLALLEPGFRAGDAGVLTDHAREAEDRVDVLRVQELEHVRPRPALGVRILEPAARKGEHAAAPRLDLLPHAPPDVPLVGVVHVRRKERDARATGLAGLRAARGVGHPAKVVEFGQRYHPVRRTCGTSATVSAMVLSTVRRRRPASWPCTRASHISSVPAVASHEGEVRESASARAPAPRRFRRRRDPPTHLPRRHSHRRPPPRHPLRRARRDCRHDRSRCVTSRRKPRTARSKPRVRGRTTRRAAELPASDVVLRACSGRERSRSCGRSGPPLSRSELVGLPGPCRLSHARPPCPTPSRPSGAFGSSPGVWPR